MCCSSCGEENRLDRVYCTRCGARLGGACPACGASNEAADQFCGRSGTGLTGTPPAAAIRTAFAGGRYGGGETALYRKQRLVPFAEYRPLADGPGAFSTGGEAVVFNVAGAHFGPSICLDIIYAGLVRASVRAGADVLLNLSNDSWLAAGRGGAATQQLAQAVFRAVENRRDVVRAATTGISAVIGADGVPGVLLAERRAGAFVAAVHPRRGLMPSTRWRDAFAWGCVVLAAMAVRVTPLSARGSA